MPFVIEPMTPEDIPEVSQLEQRCFPNPWPTSAYRRELRDPERNFYIVARWHDPHEQSVITHHPSNLARSLIPFIRRNGPAKSAILGFGGMWVLLDEAHITTIGVAPELRGRSLGEYLFITMIDEARRRLARWVTLEVRVSNQSAQGLYEKYGFTRQGVRRRYYSDNGEDAYLMWSPSLIDPSTITMLQEHREIMNGKLALWHDSLDRLSNDVQTV